MLDERRVREAAVGDEDGEARPDAERHDGAVPLEEAPQQGLDLGGRVGEPHHAAEERQGRRARREARALAPRAVEAEEEERGGDEEEERPEEELGRVHGWCAPNRRVG